MRAFGLSGGHAAGALALAGCRGPRAGVVRQQTRFFGRLNLAEFVGVAAVLTAGFFLVRSASIGAASAAALYFTYAAMGGHDKAHANS